MSRNKDHASKSDRGNHHDLDSGHKGKGQLLVGTNGDDILAGGSRNDLIIGRKGNDSLEGGAGNDVLIGDGGFGGKHWGWHHHSWWAPKGQGDDYLDGGAGNDLLLAGRGDDVANYTLSENQGAHDVYDGGKGFDTLRLTFTQAELNLVSVQKDIDAFEAFLDRKANPNSDSGKTFHFQSFDLDARNFEALEIVTIGGNTEPVALGDNYGAVEDETLGILAPGVLFNDSDAESSPLTASVVTGPTNGSVTMNGNGSFTYTPILNYFGEDSFTYKANDGALDSNVTTVNLTIAAVNDPPVAEDDVATVAEDSSGNVIGVLGNDSKGAANESGQSLAVSAASALHGAVLVNPDGTLSYTPNADYFGPDTINYTVTDNGTTNGLPNPLADSAQVAITVTGVNDAPVAEGDTITETAVDGRIRVAVVGVQGSSTHNEAAGQLDATIFNADAISYTTDKEWATILSGYEVVVLGDSGFFDYGAATGIFAAMSSFVDQGGGVVTTGWFARALALMADPIKGDANHVTPITPAGHNFTQLNATITVDSTHEITDDIPSEFQSSPRWELANMLDAGATPLATGIAADPDQPGRIGTVLPTIAYDDDVGRDDVAGLPGGQTVYLGGMYLANDFFRPDLTRSGVLDEIFEQAVAWAAGARSGPSAATVIIDVLANDTDVDTAHADLYIDSFSPPGAPGAAISVDANGDIVYTPGAQGLLDLLAGQEVTDSFDYTVSDGNGGFDTASVSLTITGLDTLL